MALSLSILCFLVEHVSMCGVPDAPLELYACLMRHQSLDWVLASDGTQGKTKTRNYPQVQERAKSRAEERAKVRAGRCNVMAE